MGLLRTILALAVVATHTTRLLPFSIIPGSLAVQTFYIISGFYMALILTDKYSNKTDSYKLFMVNRALRIYPIYFLILIATVIFYVVRFLINHEPNALTALGDEILQANWIERFLIVFMSLFILGRDVVLFIDIPALNSTFLVPQASILSLELIFYLIVPFLIRKRFSYLCILFLGSICLRIYLAKNGLADGPWQYQFFPTALAFFLTGIFSFRIFEKIRHKQIPFLWNAFVFSMVIGLIISLVYLPFQPLLKAIIYLGIVVLSLPFVFYLTKNNAIDRWIGDFSYPIYISHFLVKEMVRDYMQMTGNFMPYWGWWVAIGSCILSLLLLYLVIYPIDRIREGRVLSHKL